MFLLHEILKGDHECDTELLMAKVILIHKNKDIAILDHYRPIALLNTIYQLIMLIITSRLRQLTEYYAVTSRSTNGGPKGPLGATTGDERVWHLDTDRFGFQKCLQLSGTLLPLGNS